MTRDQACESGIGGMSGMSSSSFHERMHGAVHHHGVGYRTLCGFSMGLVIALSPSMAAAQTLEPIVVTATRRPQPAIEVPTSVDEVGPVRLREAGPGLQLSEALALVPGLVALDRRNWAQDLQLSSRGFGARSTFGVRGVRLLEDGIPLTQPDGQGQTGSFNLAAAERVEVLRGPAAVLYGNAPGGVVQVFTAEPNDPAEWGVGLVAGDQGLRQASVYSSGRVGEVSAVVRATRMQLEGDRAHSRSARTQWHGRFQWEPSPSERLTWVLSHTDMPEVQDPLGLTEAQWLADARQAGSAAEQHNTRKGIQHGHTGLVYELRSPWGRSQAMVYGGERSIVQFQAIPAPPASGAQNAPSHPGGVIDLQRRFAGADVRHTFSTEGNWGALDATFGMSHDLLHEDRRGYQNFDSAGQLGVRGQLKRDERNSATTADAYAWLSWTSSPAWQWSAGWRPSRVNFRSRDRYIAPGNGDDSGRVSYNSSAPVVSVMWTPIPRWQWYATAGRSSETPTLNEVAYRSANGSQTGWNSTLRASAGRQVELGSKWRGAAGKVLNAAVYRIDTDGDIGILSNSGGRTVFQNVGRTRREGVELSAAFEPAAEWRVQAAGSFGRAVFLDGYVRNSQAGPSAVTAGKHLPGVPLSLLYAEVAWRPKPVGPHAGLEWRQQGRIWADDANTTRSPSQQQWAARAGWRWGFDDWRFDALARVENLTDARLIGALIVNEANGRYFEPAPGRQMSMSVSVSRPW